MSIPRDIIEIGITIPAELLPGPEEMAEIDLGDGYFALVENRNERRRAPADAVIIDAGELFFAVANGDTGAVVTHAVRYRRGLRLVPDTYALCSRDGKSRRARGIRRGAPLSSVTCEQCTARLRKAGAVVLAETTHEDAEA